MFYVRVRVYPLFFALMIYIGWFSSTQEEGNRSTAMAGIRSVFSEYIGGGDGGQLYETVVKSA